MIQTIKCLKLKPKAGAALWGIINGVMKNAKINRQIPENPCEYINTRLFQKHYDKSKKTAAERTSVQKKQINFIKYCWNQNKRNRLICKCMLLNLL